ncbi:hypothetical protein Lsan_3664 [Legionella santicrucis]|uniref:Uncharacterized protein n=1 Tax=Legionella santicrucis TaxID=45074 RepID=A0A0W0Y9G2_9GAMM|nr:hypothetical protein Lsan_3664 [Legionella santicrucis]
MIRLYLAYHSETYAMTQISKSNEILIPILLAIPLFWTLLNKAAPPRQNSRLN